MTHKQAAIKGLTWISGHKFFSKISSLIKLTVAARILTPADFGVTGFAYLLLSLTEIATETGFTQAAIQDKNHLEPKLGTIWFVEALKGVIVAVIIFLSADLFSTYFAIDSAKYIKLLSLVPLIKGFANPNVISLQKNLAFRRFSFFQLTVSLIENISAIFLVLILKSPVALIYSSIIGALSKTLISFIVVKIHIGYPNILSIKQLFSYGRWVTAGSILTYLNDQIDDFAVAKLSGSTSLGFYQTAFKISNLPTTEATGLLYQVFFPIFSSLKDTPEKLKSSFQKVMIGSVVISSLSIISIIIVLPYFIKYVIGDQWQPIVSAIYLLSVFGFFRSVTSLNAALFDATGKPSVAFMGNAIKLTVLAIIIIPMTIKYSYLGAAVSVSVAQAMSVPWYFVKTREVFR